MLPHSANTQATARAVGQRIPSVDRDKGYPRDAGCHVHPSCLTCPLPRCVFEQAEGASPDVAAQHDARQWQARMLHTQGFGPSAIAAKLRCARRTVYRLLAEL